MYIAVLSVFMLAFLEQLKGASIQEIYEMGVVSTETATLVFRIFSNLLNKQVF
jgi:hypothetical protein